MIGTIIIAAGESRRLKQPKQLVSWRGEPLIRRSAKEALNAGLGPVAVVLGAVDAPCRQALGAMNAEIIHYPGWSGGMGGSIAAGMRAFAGRELQAIIVMLCDQPLVTHQTLDRLEAEWHRSGCRIVASRYGANAGPPALFSADCFERLAALQGESGAKAIIRNDPSVSYIDCPEGAFDVDTLEDLRHLENVIPMVPALQPIH